MKRYIAMGTIAWLCLFGAAVQAENRAYQIELLVFAQDHSSNETFDQEQSEIDWPNRLADPGNFQIVAPENMSLGGIKSQLQRRGGYRPLLHLAWSQSIPANAYGTAVQVQDGAGTLNGFFRVERGNLLHMTADLEYSPNGTVYYRLNEKRRFKLNEIHYLDHPKFGVIALVTPSS